MTLKSLFRAIVYIAAASSMGYAQTAAAPTKPFLVGVNQRAGLATLIELSSGKVTQVDVDLDPHEVAISPDGRIAALTIPSEMFRSSRKVVVLDLLTARVARTVQVGNYREPHGVAFVNDSVALIGTLGGTSAIYVDVRNGRVLRAVEGLPENPYIVKLTATGRAYVSSPHSSKVTEIDVGAARVTRSLSIPDDPAGIAVSADGKELYAAVWRQNAGGGFLIYDLEKGAVAAKLPATQPRRIAVTDDGKHVVFSDRDHFRIVDRATRQMRSVELGRNSASSGVACSSDSRMCYVSLQQPGEVAEIDITAARVVRRFEVRSGIDGLAFVPR